MQDKLKRGASVRVRGFGKVACRYAGPQIERVWNDDDDFEEIEEIETGRALVVMVGDDYQHVVDFEDIEPLDREDYCGECGQIGCTHDGYDRGDS